MNNQTKNWPQETAIESTSNNAPGVLQIDLRDWFAWQILPVVDARSHGTPADVAAECYQMADAMLAKREKGSK